MKISFTKDNFSAELRFLFDDTSVLLCATPCDRKIGAICAEKSSYTRVDGNQQGKKKMLRRKIPFVWTRKERRPTEEQEYNVDWRLVRIFRQFLHQFFSSHFCGHATKSHFSVTIRQQHIIQFHITHSWNSIFSQYQGSSRYLHFCFGFLSFDSNSNKNRRNNTKKGWM